MTPTAAILIIGNEILSGSTQEANVAHIGRALSARGVRLAEVRIVRDAQPAIVAALNALRAAYDVVFTTGGIGPTHDDITAESVAAAFGVEWIVHEETRRKMQAHYEAQGSSLNAARLRMAMLPEGATPIECDVSPAPAFRTGNVYTLAGVPRIMQAQLAAIGHELPQGPAILSRTVQCNQKEGDIAAALSAIQRDFPAVDIGSYPHMGERPSLSLILRGTDARQLDAAASRVAGMVRGMGEEPIVPAS